jgi:hypothetical protein
MDVWDTNSNDHSENLLKINALDFVCRLQEEKCLTNMSAIFDKINPDYFYNPNEVVNSYKFVHFLVNNLFIFLIN